MQNLGQYWKAIVALLGAVIVIGTEVVNSINSTGADGDWSTADWITTAVVLLTALGVYSKANNPPVTE